jgi:hypothetical protein
MSPQPLPAATPNARARLLVVLLCVLTAVGCAVLEHLADLSFRIQNEGYTGTSVHHGTSNGFDTLTVTTHKATEQTDDGETIFRLIWDTYPEDVDRVVVTVNNRKTSATKAELLKTYGPRKIQPAGNASGSGKVDALIFIAFLFACGATAAMIVRGRRRRRREQTRPPYQPRPYYKEP